MSEKRMKSTGKSIRKANRMLVSDTLIFYFRPGKYTVYQVSFGHRWTGPFPITGYNR